MCLSAVLYAHGVHPYEKCDYKWEREWESGVSQLAWHLAWHIVARPRSLPVRSNVAVDKPIKKLLLNALSLLLFHALQHRPEGMPATWRREKGEERQKERGKTGWGQTMVPHQYGQRTCDNTVSDLITLFKDKTCVILLCYCL